MCPVSDCYRWLILISAYFVTKSWSSQRSKCTCKSVEVLRSVATCVTSPSWTTRVCKTIEVYTLVPWQVLRADHRRRQHCHHPHRQLCPRTLTAITWFHNQLVAVHPRTIAVIINSPVLQPDFCCIRKLLSTIQNCIHHLDLYHHQAISAQLII